MRTTNMKKWILGLSAVAAVATPVVAVVSCGESTIIKKTVTEIKAKRGEDHSQDFNTIQADGIAWNAGVAYHSSSQGISYIMNIAKELGWNEPEDQLDFSRKIEGYTTRTDASATEKAIMAEPIMQMNGDVGSWAQDLNTPNFSAAATNGLLDWDGHSLLTLEPATDANIKFATSHYSKVMPEAFKTATNAEKAKMFADALVEDKDHLIPYEIGSKVELAAKVLFQIDESKNALHVWLGADSEATVAKTNTISTNIKNALDNMPIVATPATPAAGYWIDPVGSSGTMDPWWFTQAATHIGFDLGDTKDEHNSNNSFGLNNGGGNFDVVGQVVHYQAMLDAKKPGSTIIRAWINGKDKNHYVKTWHSNDHVVRTYPKATDAQNDEISKLLIESISNIKLVVDEPSLSMLGMFTNDSFVQLIKWISTFDITEEKVKEAVVALNNFPEVAHHVDAVLAFLRGWKNIPAAEQPGAGGTANLNGLSYISNPMDLIPWFKMTQDNHAYVKAAPAAPAETIY